MKKFEVIITAATAQAVDRRRRRPGANDGRVRQYVRGARLRHATHRECDCGRRKTSPIKSVSTWIGTEFASPPKFTSESELRDVCPRRFAPSGCRSSCPAARRPTRSQPRWCWSCRSRLPASSCASMAPRPRSRSRRPSIPTTRPDLSTQSWNSESQRVVDLGPALAALTGNPLDESVATFTATVTSRVPGILDLQLRPGGQDVLRIRRVTFNGQPIARRGVRIRRPSVDRARISSGRSDGERCPPHRHRGASRGASDSAARTGTARPIVRVVLPDARSGGVHPAAAGVAPGRR